MRPRLSVWMLFLCVSALPGFAQTPASPSRRPDLATPMGDADEARARLANEMAKKAAKERVVALKHDTDKLLSVEVIKKAEEIEKLAKSVKEKMKGPN